MLNTVLLVDEMYSFYCIMQLGFDVADIFERSFRVQIVWNCHEYSIDLILSYFIIACTFHIIFFKRFNQSIYWMKLLLILIKSILNNRLLYIL